MNAAVMELYGEKVDEFRDPIADVTPIYGHPDEYFGPIDPRWENKTREIIDTAGRILYGETAIPLQNPRYVFTTRALPKNYGIVLTPQGIFPIPGGHATAVYDPDYDAVGLDEGAIPGTAENARLKTWYRAGIKTVDYLASVFPSAKGFARGMKSFYSDMLKKLERVPVVDAIHEGVHRIIEHYGLSKFLSRDENEALTVSLTDEVAGESSVLEGTSYRTLGNRMKGVLNSLGYYSAKDAVKRYMEDSSVGSAITKKYREWFPKPVLA